MMRRAGPILIALAAIVPFAAAQAIPDDSCENKGGSYVPYEAPEGILRVVIRVEGAPTPFTWCLYQGTDVLIVRYDLVQQEDTEEPYVYTFDYYPEGTYTVGLQSSAGVVRAGGNETLDVASCSSGKGEFTFRLVHPDAATFGLDHGSECLNETVPVTPGVSDPGPPSYTSDDAPQPRWQTTLTAPHRAPDTTTAAPDPAGIIAAVGLVSLAVLALSAEKVRIAYLALLGRTLGNRVLENPTRRALVLAIEENPGIHASALGELVQVRGGKLQHHLAILELRGSVEFVPAAGFRRYFPRGSFTPEEKEMLATLRRSIARQVYETVLGHDEPPRRLSDRLGVSEGQFSKVAHQLQRVGLLERREHAGRVQWVAHPLPTRIASYVF